MSNERNFKKVKFSELNSVTKNHNPKPLKKKFDVTKIDISEEYRSVKKLLEDDEEFIFVTGRAGTGKTTLINYLKVLLPKKNIMVVAPTGIAALNAGGQTIHSLFKFPLRFIVEEDIQPPANKKLFNAMDVLIIDEISMVRADVVDGMDWFLKLARRNDKPFGGVQVIFMGDLFQLPPVVEPQIKDLLNHYDYQSEYFFSAKSLQDCGIIPISLEKIYRQSDKKFIDLLSNIRVGKKLQETLKEINIQVKAKQKHNEIFLTPTNSVADRINTENLEKINKPEFSYIGKIQGNFNQKNLPSPMELVLKVGAQIMMTQNGVDWVNGSLGEVIHLDKNSIRVKIFDNNKILDVNKVRWETHKYSINSATNKLQADVTGWYEQFPMMIAWATTIHKSQGKTLNFVTIDIAQGGFAPGQTYVALSRCKKLENICLIKKISEKDIMVNPLIIDFYKKIERNSVNMETVYEEPSQSLNRIDSDVDFFKIENFKTISVINLQWTGNLQNILDIRSENISKGYLINRGLPISIEEISNYEVLLKEGRSEIDIENFFQRKIIGLKNAYEKYKNGEYDKVKKVKLL